jgi:hypothetical protein
VYAEAEFEVVIKAAPIQPSLPECVPGWHWDSSQLECMPDGPKQYFQLINEHQTIMVK